MTRKKQPYIVPRRAVVLVIVLVVVVVLSLAAYTFTDLMQAHRKAAILSGKQIQARLLVDSGIDAVKLYLMSDEATREEMGGHYDNPLYFQAAKVIPAVDAIDRGSFTVLAPLFDEATSQTGVRFGLEDESSRLNLNLLLVADKAQEGAARTLLMALPNMTEDVADAILDWIDEDEEAREYGCEAEYYSGLLPPYAPRNAAPETVEELLLVRGVTPDLLFGVDVNRNGMQDVNETGAAAGGLSATAMSSTASANTTSSGSTFTRGWSSFLTLYSSERNTLGDGSPRIFLNNTDLEALKEDLSAVYDETWTNFILAYRLYGPFSGQANGETADAGSVTLDLTQQPKATFSQVLDLIGKQVQITQGGRQTLLLTPFENSPIAMATYLPALMENCTVSESITLPGRININQAPREILMGIPGITEEIVDEIVSRRSEETTDTTQNRQHETWLLSESIVTLDEMRVLTPFVNAGGDVFRAQIVGYYQGGGPSARYEVVFDATETTPRLLFLRDISHLGRGYALETLGVELVSAE
jgi:DNA uptake protein ComE-like DNA-binding protein